VSGCWAAFDLVSARDGSCHTVQGWGEASMRRQGHRQGDVLGLQERHAQASAVPVASEMPMPPAPRSRSARSSPVEGWQAWSEGILDMIKACESGQALDRVRTRQASLLAA
jgi:hypothetical protein